MEEVLLARVSRAYEVCAVSFMTSGMISSHAFCHEHPELSDKGRRFILGICSFLRSGVRVFPIRLMLKLLCHLSPRHLLEKTSQNILEYLYSTEAGLGEEPGLSYP